MATSSKYGVTGITMHHSIQRGRTVHVPASGSTNLGGGNGAGKTSTMKLIPIFWGLDPERTVVQAGGNKSFKEHYLPSPASMLIYHYTRDDGPYMSVMYLHSKGIVYRFVKGEWHETFSHPSLKNLLREGKSASELFDALQDFGVQVSSPIRTIIEYRAIIQNNKKLLRGGQKLDRKSIHLAQQYCVGHAGVSIQYMDDLCYALLYRKTIFSRLKEMICGTMFEDLHVSEKPEHFKNVQLIDNINGLREFSANETLITSCLNNHLKYQSTESDLNSLTRSLNEIIKVEEVRLDTLEKAREMLITESCDVEEKHETEIQDLKEKSSESEQTLKTAKNHIENIYSEKEQWEKSKVEEKINSFENLPGLKKRAENAEIHLSNLKKEITEPEMQRNERRTKTSELRDNERKRLDGECINLIANIQKLKDHAQEQNHNIVQVLEQELDRYRQEESRLYEKFSTELGRLEAESRQSTKTAEEQLDEASAEENLQQAQEKEEQLKIDMSTIENELRVLEARRDEAATSYESCRKAANDIQEDLLRLTEQLYPQDNSLLAVLKNSTQPWTENLGLIVNPDLLSRKDLSPVFHSDFLPAVYGWEFDLTHLDKPSFCESDAFLKAEHEKHELLFRNANDDLGKAKNRLDELNNSHNDCFKKVALATHQYENAKKHRGQAFYRKKEVLNDIKSKVSKRTIEIKKIWEQKRSEFNDWKTGTEEKRQGIKTAYNNKIIEINSRLAIEAAEIQESIETRRKAQETVENEYKLQIEAIDQQFSDECRQKGVPPETISAARVQAEKLRN